MLKYSDQYCESVLKEYLEHLESVDEESFAALKKSFNKVAKLIKSQYDKSVFGVISNTIRTFTPEDLKDKKKCLNKLVSNLNKAGFMKNTLKNNLLILFCHIIIRMCITASAAQVSGLLLVAFDPAMGAGIIPGIGSFAPDPISVLI